MDEVAKTKLVALATTQIKAKLVAMMDIASAQFEGRRFMGAAAESVGLSVREGEKLLDDNFQSFQKDLEKWAEERAAGEISAAVEEAEEEQERHGLRLSELRQSHHELVEKLADSFGDPEVADDELIKLLKSHHEEMVRHAEKSHENFVAILQERHRLNLWHCFSKHLVPEGTVLLQLIDLYEIK